MRPHPSSIAAFAAALVVLAAGSSPAATLVVPMHAQNASGETGTAKLTDTPKGLKVVISVKSALKDQPAHIHPGTCAKLNPAPKYPLTLVSAGTSTSVVKGVTLAELIKAPFAINVHESTTNITKYVSCGDIKK